MESNTVFECGNPKCAYAIDSADLNTVQLKVLRSTAKRCPACKVLTRFNEQLPLLNTKTISSANGGSNYEKTIFNPNSDLPKSASQRRKAARHDGRH